MNNLVSPAAQAIASQFGIDLTPFLWLSPTEKVIRLEKDRLALDRYETEMRRAERALFTSKSKESLS